MADSQKVAQPLSADNVMREIYSHEDKSIATSGFIDGLVGRKITQTITTTSVSGDTSIFNYEENGVTLKTVKVIYTDATQATLVSVERIG